MNMCLLGGSGVGWGSSGSALVLHFVNSCLLDLPFVNTCLLGGHGVVWALPEVFWYSTLRLVAFLVDKGSVVFPEVFWYSMLRILVRLVCQGSLGLLRRCSGIAC